MSNPSPTTVPDLRADGLPNGLPNRILATAAERFVEGDIMFWRGEPGASYLEHPPRTGSLDEHLADPQFAAVARARTIDIGQVVELRQYDMFLGPVAYLA